MPDPVLPSQDRSAPVLCGGGGHGALEVGFAKALYETGHRPDMILGSSIGALNGAFLAAGTELATLERCWPKVIDQKRPRPDSPDGPPRRAVLQR